MQTTLLRCWNPPEVVIPEWTWWFHRPCGTGKALGDEGAFALYWDSDVNGLDPFTMFWFDIDGQCDNWEVVY
jgi:hypothetical protein